MGPEKGRSSAEGGEAAGTVSDLDTLLLDSHHVAKDHTHIGHA